MLFGFPTDPTRSSDSWFARLLAAPHPDAFTAGVHERGRWRFAVSAVDPYQPDGVVTMRHGKRTLRLRPEGVLGTGRRPGHVLLHAVDVDSLEHRELSVPEGDLARFGVDA